MGLGRCPRCPQRLQGGANFCPRCGKALRLLAPPPSIPSASLPVARAPGPGSDAGPLAGAAGAAVFGSVIAASMGCVLLFAFTYEGDVVLMFWGLVLLGISLAALATGVSCAVGHRAPRRPPPPALRASREQPLETVRLRDA